MEKLAAAFAVTLGKYVSKEAVVFIISMIPIHAHEKHQPPELVALDVVALAHGLVLQLLHQSAEKSDLLHPFKNLLDKKQDERDRNQRAR